MKEIREPGDVTETHIEDAVAMRLGEGGWEKMSWEDVIDRLEGLGEDWGNDMSSPAIKHLQREVRRAIREAA